MMLWVAFCHVALISVTRRSISASSIRLFLSLSAMSWGSCFFLILRRGSYQSGGPVPLISPLLFRCRALRFAAAARAWSHIRF